MNIHVRKSDFCLAEGKGFSFYYPKYEFYSGSVNDDKTSFHFASADGATTLEVYREKLGMRKIKYWIFIML